MFLSLDFQCRDCRIEIDVWGLTRAVAHAGEEEAAGQDAVGVADIEAYKVKDLWLELEVMSPVSSAGSYSVAVVLYDGGEPVQAAGSPAGTKAQSQFKVCQCCSMIITVCLAPGVQG